MPTAHKCASSPCHQTWSNVPLRSSATTLSSSLASRAVAISSAITTPTAAVPVLGTSPNCLSGMNCRSCFLSWGRSTLSKVFERVDKRILVCNCKCPRKKPLSAHLRNVQEAEITKSACVCLCGIVCANMKRHSRSDRCLQDLSFGTSFVLFCSSLFVEQPRDKIRFRKCLD